MEKIAFVVVRYGKDINGGAEFHCKMLAERLINQYQVEVLTTCVKTMSPEITNFLKEKKISMEFLSVDLKPTLFIKKNILIHERGKTCSKVKKVLVPIPPSGISIPFCPIWTFRRKYEINALNSNVFIHLLCFHSSKNTKRI